LAQSVSATQAFAHCFTPEPRFRFFGPSSVASAQSKPRAQSFVEAQGEASALPVTERISQMPTSDSTEKPPKMAAVRRGRLRAAGKIFEKGNTVQAYQKMETMFVRLDATRAQHRLTHMAEKETGREVSLFRNGANQALRIPRRFELPGTSATLTREGETLVIRPAPPRSFLSLLRTLKAIRVSFPEQSDALPEPVDV
jgi:antitoxin VapB